MYIGWFTDGGHKISSLLHNIWEHENYLAKCAIMCQKIGNNKVATQPGEPGKVREFDIRLKNQGKVREFENFKARSDFHANF